MLSGRGLCDELITGPEESYRLCCVVVCDLETSRIGAPYVYDISSLRVNETEVLKKHEAQSQRIGTASQPDYDILEDMYFPSFFTSFTG